MTRRSFFGMLGAGLLGFVPAITWHHELRSMGHSTAADRNTWAAAWDVVRSGELGTILWAQVIVPPGIAQRPFELQPLLGAMGVRERPSRITHLAEAAHSTTIVEFVSAPPVYLATGSHAQTTIRGTRARLHVGDRFVRVVACHA